MSIRNTYIKGLRDLADWLEANPAAPLQPCDSADVQHSVDLYFPDRTDAVRKLDEVAALLGLKAGPVHGDGDDRYYGIRVQFGPVRYTAVSIDEAAGGAR